MQLGFVSLTVAEFRWFLPKEDNDCNKVPQHTFTGTPLALKDSNHFVCWKDLAKTPLGPFEVLSGRRAAIMDGVRNIAGGHFQGEDFKLGDCGEECCDLIHPVDIERLFIK